jgi:hypothetical protein
MTGKKEGVRGCFSPAALAPVGVHPAHIKTHSFIRYLLLSSARRRSTPPAGFPPPATAGSIQITTPRKEGSGAGGHAYGNAEGKSGLAQ